jgi:hypothetical protein
VHTRRLGRLVVTSINGKHDDKHSEPNTPCILSFNKNKKTLRKVSVKQANKENQVIEQMGNQIY